MGSNEGVPKIPITTHSPFFLKKKKKKKKSVDFCKAVSTEL